MLVNPLTQDGRDWVLWGTLSLLITYGMVAFLSASIDISTREFGGPFQLAFKQGITILLSLFVMWFASLIDTDFYKKNRFLLWWLGLGGLFLVLVPDIGVERNYATRWISLLGITYQPSEFAKLAYIIYIAGFIKKHKEELRYNWLCVMRVVFLPAAIYCVLLLLEPDFGSTVEIMLFTLSMTFLAGSHLFGFLILAIILTVVVAGLVALAPYRLQRLTQFLDPWQDQFDTGYNLTQSLMAIGRGDFTGVGLGNSIHKLDYLPEAHTDFIFSIIAEELGLVGVSILILLYGIMIWRLWRLYFIALKHQQIFSGMLVLGITLWLFFQVFINIAGTIQLLPPKGLVLPFFSQGGSFILTYCLALGIVARIEKEVNQKRQALKQE